MRFGMVIDLARCIGCYSCVIACKQEHFLPAGISWNRVLMSETGEYPLVRKEVFPIQCNHCKEPICVEVCPSGATIQREDGIVWVEQDKCTGCRYCLLACPYQSRVFYSDRRESFPGQGLVDFEKKGDEVSPYQKKIVLKCTFCKERIDGGIKKGLVPGKDREATPACVITCPTKARVFGDLDAHDSEVSELIREKKAVQFHPEFETEASTFYIQR